MNAEPKMTSTEAQQVLAAERQQRIADCAAAIQQTLETFNCRLEASVTLRANAVIPQIAIVTND